MTIHTKKFSFHAPSTLPTLRRWTAFLWLAFACAIGHSYTAQALQEDEAAKAKIEMEPIIYTMVKRGRPKAKVTVRVGIQLMDGVDFEPINNRIPQIRADFISLLAALSTQRFRMGQAIDPVLVSTYFQYAVDRRVGKDQLKVFVLEAGIEPF